MGELEVNIVWVYVLIALVFVGLVVGMIVCCCLSEKKEEPAMQEEVGDMMAPAMEGENMMMMAEELGMDMS